MVWSPLSNLLLYGATAHVDVMRANSVPIGLGSDWSPSGSKNLLGELKVARLVSANAPQGPIFSDQELVAMVTTTAARMLGWDAAIGSLEAGQARRPDRRRRHHGRPVLRPVDATERDLVLVMIGGTGCAGQPHLIEPFTANGEKVTIGGRSRLLNFALAGADPDVALVSLAQARSTLQDALANLVRARPRARAPGRRRGAGRGSARAAPSRPAARAGRDRAHPHDHAKRLPEAASRCCRAAGMLAAQPPLSTVLGPLTLDGLTVADDPAFMATLQAEQNLPPYLAPALAAAYATGAGTMTTPHPRRSTPATATTRGAASSRPLRAPTSTRRPTSAPSGGRSSIAAGSTAARGCS